MALHVIEHPLVQHKLTLLRKSDTGPKDFRELVEEIATLMAYECTRDLPLEEVEIETPLTRAYGRAIVGKKLSIVPILRAGLGMLNGILRLIPNAKVGHIGLYRDEKTLQPVEYYCKLPEDLPERDVLLLDPMLATGGSAAAAVEFLKARGARSQSIKFLCLLASPQGIATLRESDPEVDIYTASVDDRLNDKGYILPGLGDAGDRIFGTL
ncbi:MAG: uracil phosphoribosyltransferase [Candidatus Eremiobacteraeota bacterium]|nr:uracil phosphoribosyltransferase [Candidatus Eremiobacteraeota bacterium]